jgi:hypothetical protein
MAGEKLTEAEDEWGDCDACGADHPVGVLEGGLCPECCDTVMDFARRQALKDTPHD